MASFYTKQAANKRRTILLFTVFLIVVIGVGFVFAQVDKNPINLYIAIAIAIAMNIAAYWFSDKLVIGMARAKPADEGKYRELHRIVENLCITAGLPKPRLYIVYEAQLNAFATGRDPEHAALAVTEGLLAHLSRSELEGVIAHELSHIGNRDMLVSTAAVVLVGFISILGDIFIRTLAWGRHGGGSSRREGASGAAALIGFGVALLAPLGAVLIQLAISRQREYLADATGVLLTRYPDGLASALEKISADTTPMRAARTSTAHLWIANPFKGKKGMGGLFQTHPPVAKRISRLRGRPA